ncbi:MAG: DUF1328 family protein [Halobacteriota archaeon]
MAFGSLLWLAIVFLIIAIVAAFLGLGGVAGLSLSIVWILVVIFIILFIVSLVVSLMRA